MNSRIWVVAGALVVIVVLALGGLLGVKPQLDAAALSDSDREGVEALNVQHEAELASLKDQFTRLDAMIADVGALRVAVPSQPDLDGLTGELAALQAQYGVTVTSYTPQAATMFVPSADIIAEVPATIDSTNLVTISVAITIKGSRDAALGFVAGLQSGGRLVLVSDLTVSAEQEGETTIDIAGLVYALLDQPYSDPAAATPAPAVDATASE